MVDFMLYNSIIIVIVSVFYLYFDISHGWLFFTTVLVLTVRVLGYQDEEEIGGAGYNTSDEEFERQLEEAALIQEQEKVEKLRRPKVKKGRGRNARKRTKKNSHFPNDPDAEGYEVRTLNRGLWDHNMKVIIRQLINYTGKGIYADIHW